MNNNLERQVLGIGVITDDPSESMAEATQITTFLLRHFAHQADEPGPEPELESRLKQAHYYTLPLEGRYTLQLALLETYDETPYLPQNHLALITLTTRYWKRGRPQVMKAAHLVIDRVLQQFQLSSQQVAIQQIAHTHARRYFAYQIFIRAQNTQERAVAS